jgi:hypothetical protein
VINVAESGLFAARTIPATVNAPNKHDNFRIPSQGVNAGCAGSSLIDRIEKFLSPDFEVDKCIRSIMWNPAHPAFQTTADGGGQMSGLMRPIPHIPHGLRWRDVVPCGARWRETV